MRITKWIVGLVVGCSIVGAVAFFVLERLPTVPLWFFDHNDDPDSRIVHAAVSAASQTANDLDLRLDLSAVNGGAWQVLCLIGGYESPVGVTSAFARKHGVRVNAFSQGWSWLRTGDAPEPDLALAYVTPNGVLYVYRLRGPEVLYQLEHVRTCVTRRDPVAQLPASYVKKSKIQN